MKPWTNPNEEQAAIDSFIDSLKEECPSCENEVDMLFECWVDPYNEYRRQSFVCRGCLNKHPETFSEIL